MRSAAPVVVTGLGAISGAGPGCAALWACAADGRDVLGPIRRFAARELAGVVPGWDEVALVGDGGVPAQSLCVAFAVAAAREAIADAGLDLAPERLALVFGTNLYDRPTSMSGLAAAVADAIGATGPRLAVSTACASSASAIAIALHLLRSDRVDAVLAGGADVLTPLVVGAFRSLRVLALDRCAPFSTPSGLSLGEGAAFLVLERHEHAAARGRASTSALLAAGLAGDGFHPTSPDPRGEGIAASVRRALRRAGVDPAEIAYINTHGTGTDSNDIAEWRGLARVFGERVARVPISASKSILGHAQGAAGALEAVLSLLGHRQRLAPPTLRHVGSRPGVAADAIAEGRPRAFTGDAILSVNAGFGGACAALRSGRPNAGSQSGLARCGCAAWLARAPTRRRSSVPSSPQAWTLAPTPWWQLRSCPLGQMHRRPATVAVPGAASSWPSDRCHRPRARRRGRRTPPWLRPGPGGSARGLLVSPAGACQAALGLRGPLCAFSGGAATALAALTLAAEEIAQADDVGWMLAAAVDEPEVGEATAACVVLGEAASPGSPVALAGWAVLGAGRRDAVVRDALNAAGLTGPIPTWECGATLAGVRRRSRRYNPARPNMRSSSPTIPGRSRVRRYGVSLADRRYEHMDPVITATVARREHILAIVRSVLVEDLGVALPVDQIDPDMPLFGLGLALDSVDALDLALSLEERTGRRLTPGVEAMTALRSVNAIVDFVLEGADAAP
ncbi:MAG: hypothetical protein IPJ59_00375 [Nannocystis sp.]|nr:hypothetical protein [Nannocystis sp.]